MCDTAIVQTTVAFSFNGRINCDHFCDSYARYVNFGIENILKDVDGEWELDELNFDISSNIYDKDTNMTLAWTKIDLLVTDFSDDTLNDIGTKLMVEDCMKDWLHKFNYKSS